MEKSMKKIALSLVLLIATATAARADTVYGTVISVTPNYTYSHRDIPYETCYETRVPVYGNTAPNAGDVLAGAIIGGVIGNQFGSGSGQDAMTALGAIVGANAAGNGTRQGVVGYREQVECVTEYQSETRQHFEDYSVVVRWGNNTSTIYTTREYYVGETVRLQIK
jgi:uncharacterized protein YcfJ